MASKKRLKEMLKKIGKGVRTLIFRLAFPPPFFSGAPKKFPSSQQP